MKMLTRLVDILPNLTSSQTTSAPGTGNRELLHRHARHLLRQWMEHKITPFHVDQALDEQRYFISSS